MKDFAMVQGTVMYKGKPYLKLSDDIGGLILIGTFVRTESVEICEEFKEEDDE